MKTIIHLITALLLISKANCQNAEDIIRKSVDAIEFEAFEMTATLKITDAKGSERIRQIATAEKRFGDVSKMIMKFTAPPEIKGTGMLIFDYTNRSDDMWLYLPALRKVRRIVSAEKGKSFMGSEFSNADMSKPSLQDYNYKLLGSETYNGKDCWKIESVCRTESIAGEMGFSRKVSLVEKEANLCLHFQTYDMNNNLLKTGELSNYKKQPNGRYFAFLITIKNSQNNRSSSLTIDKFQLGSGMKETDFSPALLEK